MRVHRANSDIHGYLIMYLLLLCYKISNYYFFCGTPEGTRIIG